MGNPNANLRACVGAVTVMNTPTARQRTHVFVETNDQMIWCKWFDADKAEWNWAPMGKPTNGANLVRPLGTVTVMNGPGLPQRGHVFIQGDDSSIWCLYSDTAKWQWLDMGKPSGGNIRTSLGTVTMMEAPNWVQRPYVFVETEDRNVRCRYSTGQTWLWADMRKPATTTIRASMGAVAVQETPTAQQRAQVFVQGDDLAIWRLTTTDGATWNWDSLGKPPNLNVVLSPMGAVTVQDPPTSPPRPHVFMMSPDNTLLCLWLDTTGAWRWDTIGKPNVQPTMMGAVAAMDKPGWPPRAHLFVQDHSLVLHVCQGSGGKGWDWVELPKPSVTVNPRKFMGAVSVQDKPGEAQRPHVFVQGDSDLNLWCVWANI
jgi:hypothetical protein